MRPRAVHVMAMHAAACSPRTLRHPTRVHRWLEIKAFGQSSDGFRSRVDQINVCDSYVQASRTDMKGFQPRCFVVDRASLMHYRSAVGSSVVAAGAVRRLAEKLPDSGVGSSGGGLISIIATSGVRNLNAVGAGEQADLCGRRCFCLLPGAHIRRAVHS